MKSPEILAFTENISNKQPINNQYEKNSTPFIHPLNNYPDSC